MHTYRPQCHLWPVPSPSPSEWLAVSHLISTRDVVWGAHRAMKGQWMRENGCSLPTPALSGGMAVGPRSCQPWTWVTDRKAGSVGRRDRHTPGATRARMENTEDTLPAVWSAPSSTQKKKKNRKSRLPPHSRTTRDHHWEGEGEAGWLQAVAARKTLPGTPGKTRRCHVCLVKKPVLSSTSSDQKDITEGLPMIGGRVTRGHWLFASTLFVVSKPWKQSMMSKRSQTHTHLP